MSLYHIMLVVTRFPNSLDRYITVNGTLPAKQVKPRLSIIHLYYKNIKMTLVGIYSGYSSKAYNTVDK